MPEKDRLVCPLPPASGTKSILCRQTSCEWWDRDNCAITNIANLLREWAEARDEVSKRLP